jgi:hypothetical protein
MHLKSAILVTALSLSINSCRARDLYKPNRFDRIQAYITHSYIAQATKILARPFDWLLGKIMRIHTGPASEENQLLGKQAQIDLGTHPRLTVPVIKTTYQKAGGLVLPTNGHIYLNENAYINSSFGLKNQTVHHEAVHIKYADGIMKFFFAELTACSVLAAK